MNLLIVNDDVIAVAGMTSGIDWKKYGIDGEAYCACDASQAISILESHVVDIILCDIEMPGKNGIELVRHVRSSFSDIECLFLTCHAKFEYAREAISLGCTEYILAPAPYEVIADAVRSAAERVIKRQEQERLRRYGGQWLNEQTENAKLIQGDVRSPGDIVPGVETYVLANLSASDLSVNGLAERFFLNEDHLSRLFKRAKGISLHRFIIESRLELATRLLKDPGLSTMAISVRCGYSNYSNFVSLFKRYYGCTPTQYRKEKQI